MEQLRKEWEAGQNNNKTDVNTTKLEKTQTIKDTTSTNISSMKSSSFTIERLLAPVVSSEERGPPSPGTIMRAAPSPLNTYFHPSPIRNESPVSPPCKKRVSPIPSIGSPSSPPVHNFPFIPDISSRDASFSSSNSHQSDIEEQNTATEEQQSKESCQNDSDKSLQEQELCPNESNTTTGGCDDIEKSEHCLQLENKYEAPEIKGNPEIKLNAFCKSEPDVDGNFNQELFKQHDFLQYLKSNTTLLAEEWHKRWQAVEKFPSWLHIAPVNGTTLHTQS